MCQGSRYLPTPGPSGAGTAPSNSLLPPDSTALNSRHCLHTTLPMGTPPPSQKSRIFRALSVSLNLPECGTPPLDDGNDDEGTNDDVDDDKDDEEEDPPFSLPS